jgi:hypothetical protein
MFEKNVSLYKGFALLFSSKPEGLAKVFEANRHIAHVHRFDQQNIPVHVEGLGKRTKVQVIGSFMAPRSELHGNWWVKIIGRKNKNIIVPPGKIRIG